MTVIKTDTFTEASDPFLKSHTSDSGGSWQGAATTAKIESSTNSAWMSTSATITLIGDEGPTETDYFVEATVTTGGTATTDRAGVIARATDTTTHAVGSSSFYLFRITGETVGSVPWTFWRSDAGTLTATGFGGTVSGTLALVDLDDPVKLKMAVSGTGATVTITLSYDQNIDGGGFGGYSVLSTITDTAAGRLVAAGNPGFYIRDGNARIDNFNAEDTLTAGVSIPIAMHHYRTLGQ